MSRATARRARRRIRRGMRRAVIRILGTFECPGETITIHRIPRKR